MSDSEGLGTSDSSRRGFLILAGASAAAVGAVTMAPPASGFGHREKDGGQVTVEGPLVAYVSDLRKGEVSVMMGEREVLVHDPALCASLARVLA
jgi:hypothetical protein